MWCFNRLKDGNSIVTENLIWDGPFGWPKYEKDNKSKMPDVEGVYLFTFPYNNGYVLYSAGITNSTKKRLNTHTREYRKGNYNVLNVNSALQGEREEIWHGWQYAKEHRDEFMLKKENILKEVENQLEAFRIFVSEVKDVRKRERLEAAIMQNLYMSKEFYAELADRGMALRARYNSEMPISIDNHFSVKMYGIPQLLEI